MPRGYQLQAGLICLLKAYRSGLPTAEEIGGIIY